LNLYLSLPLFLFVSKIVEWLTTVKCLEHEELEEFNPVWGKMLQRSKIIVLFFLLLDMGLCVIILEFLIKTSDKLLYLIFYCLAISINLTATINNACCLILSTNAKRGEEK